MTKNKLMILALAVVAALTGLSGGALAAKTEGRAEVRLDSKAAWFGAGEGVNLQVTIANPNARAIRVLKWYTPANGIEEPLFTVTLNGEPVEYLGRHYKRPQPTEADYLVLKSGASITYTVDLAEYYDLSRSGYYAVSYDVASVTLYEKAADKFQQVEEMKSLDNYFWIEGRAAKMPPPSVATINAGTSGFTSCTSTRQSALITARSNAVTYSNNSYNYLTAGTRGARYTTWFGTYNSSRYNTVKTNFTAIRNALTNANMVFNCSCTQSYYAYVYPSQPYTIYLCNAFWSAPATGTDSKAGTLVHETSHFNVVAGTDDWAYGQTAAKNLATSNPNKATDNADSHEYFAENTPAQN